MGSGGVINFLISPVWDIIIDPAHCCTKYLVLRVNPQELGGYELTEQLLIHLKELLFTTDKVEVIMYEVNSNVSKPLNIMPFSKSVNPNSIRFMELKLEELSASFDNILKFNHIRRNQDVLDIVLIKLNFSAVDKVNQGL